MKTFDLILANTSRSEIYLSELIKKNYIPNRVLYIENDSGIPMMGQKTFKSLKPTMANPTEIKFILNVKNIKYDIIKTGELESQVTYTWLDNSEADYIVYSGFGGKILPRDFFNSSTPILHAHGGILPRYRGSTCNYYSYLESGQVGSSTIIMTELLDDGEVLDVVETEKNINLIEFDHKLDAELRIQSLLNVLKGETSRKEKICEKEVFYNYVIHPLLKHIAILRSGNFKP